MHLATIIGFSLTVPFMTLVRGIWTWHELLDLCIVGTIFMFNDNVQNIQGERTPQRK
jgi:hypothetical protein